jgi:DNA polymerase-3 subunit beta
VVGGKDFAAIISKLPSGPIEISTSGNNIVIKSKTVKYELPTMAANEFPKLSEPAGESFTISAESFKDAISKTKFATLPDDPRPFLCSVLMEISPDKMRIVATDINRLAVKDISISGNVTESLILPVKALNIIANVIAGEVTIQSDNRQVFLSCDGLTIGCRIVETQFPDFKRVIPSDFAGKFTVKRQGFIDTLERAVLMGKSEKDASVKLSIKNDLITVSNKEPDKGQFTQEVNVDQNGEQLEIGFNAKFLLDLLKAVELDKVEFRYINPNKPVLVEMDDYKYIVMPLKLAA